MDKYDRVIEGLKCCIWKELPGRCELCPYHLTFCAGKDAYKLKEDAISLLEALIPKPSTYSPEPDELPEETKAMLDKMTAEDRLKLISAICVDWDGYRTANGLGGLINEIWAYALYPIKERKHEARVLSYEEAMLDPDREVVWIELKGDPIIEPSIHVISTNDHALLLSQLGDDEGMFECYKETCGITWRPWSSKPTDELRSATEWKWEWK